MAVTPKVRKLVYERDGERCVRCGQANGLTIQHRVSKGMGGSKLYDEPAYLVTMCNPCNVGLESNYERAEEGRFNGWKLPRHSKPPVDPEKVPVKIGAYWFYLDNNGGKTPLNKEIR